MAGAGCGLPRTYAAVTRALLVAASLLWQCWSYRVDLVSAPLEFSLQPLEALGVRLQELGHDVAFISPAGPHTRWLEHVHSKLNFVPAGEWNDTIQWPGEDGSAFDYSFVLRHMRLYSDLHDTMLPALLQRYENAKARPDFVVIDRFTFAGLTACHKARLPYVVNNPTLLHDLDSPPDYIPAPYAILRGPQTILWSQTWSTINRIAFRLRMIQGFRRINAARSAIGLGPLTKEHYSNTLVLTNTVWSIERPRPLPGTFKMVGPLILPPASLDEAVQKLVSSAADAEAGVLAIDLGTHLSLTQQSFLAIARAAWYVSKVVVLVPPGQADVYRLPESAKPLNEVVFINRTAAAVHTLFQSAAVRLVIMSGWVHDMHVALYYGKPLLVVSYTREQIEMSDVVNSLGLGAAVSSSTVKEQPFELFRTVNTVLETSSYGEMAQWMSKLLRSAPGVEGSVREILNHYELEILDPGPDLSIPWYKTTCIDVYAVYALLLCGVAIIVKTLWMALKNILIRTTEHLEEQQQQLHHHHQQHPQHNRDIFSSGHSDDGQSPRSTSSSFS